MDKAFLFGEKKNLMGILSVPDGDISNKPLVLILNSGLVHRPGPFRMNKEFSYILSEHGFCSFRFDLSGIGDSEKQKMDSMLSSDRNLSDVGEAISFIKEKVNPSNIIVMGLCTGADLAHRSAVKYQDISGTIQLDSYGYPTRNFYIKRYGAIFINPKRVINLLRRVLLKFVPSKSGLESSESGADAYYWQLPEKRSYIADMELMHENGKKHLLAYTSGVRDYYNYKNQFLDSFGNHSFSSNVQIEYFNYADHLYILHKQRDALFNAMLKWVENFK